MPAWLLVALIVAALGGIIGFLTGDRNNRGKSTAADAIGCGYVLFQIFLFGAGLMMIVWLFKVIFL